MLITILLSIFGHLILVRTIKFLNSIHLLPKKNYIETNFYSFGIFFLVQLAFKDRPIAVWIFYSLILLVPFISLQLQEQIRKKIFKKEIINILDHLIILLKTGKPIREAILSCAQSYQDPIKYYILEVSSAVQHEKKQLNEIKDKLFLEFLIEIIQISKSGHKQIERLTAFRRKIKIQSDFRQKSRQVTLQIRTQATVLAIIYLSLLFFTITQFGFSGHEKLFWGSGVLFLVGGLAVLGMNRRYKWKV